jgi:prevent-host-death family protein
MERLMGTYSVADAKSGLPRLIDLALEGEEVIISRHGKPVAELRPVAAASSKAAPATYAWLKARRLARKPAGVTSVELLRQIYEDPEA